MIVPHISIPRIVVIISIAFAIIAITAAALFLLSFSFRVRRSFRPDTESIPHIRRRDPHLQHTASDSETSIQISPSRPAIFGCHEEKGEVRVVITPPTPAKRRSITDEQDL